MATVDSAPPGGNAGFRDALAPFLQQPGLPFADVLDAQAIEDAFAQRDALFATNAVFSTPVVLWAFLAQVLRDGKGAACAAAGASHYGVSDCEALARDTHKFESRYLDKLIGPYPARRDLYAARSPIRHTDGLSCPVIFLQGLEDRIVPPDQAEAMFDALRRKGIRTAYLPFEGEQHGFRKAANIQRALEAELYFLGRIFGFEPADDIEPVPIENA